MSMYHKCWYNCIFCNITTTSLIKMNHEEINLETILEVHCCTHLTRGNLDSVNSRHQRLPHGSQKHSGQPELFPGSRRCPSVGQRLVREWTYHRPQHRPRNQEGQAQLCKGKVFPSTDLGNSSRLLSRSGNDLPLLSFPHQNLFRLQCVHELCSPVFRVTQREQSFQDESLYNLSPWFLLFTLLQVLSQSDHSTYVYNALLTCNKNTCDGGLLPLPTKPCHCSSIYPLKTFLDAASQATHRL